MTEEKKPKRTLNNIPASEWGPRDNNTVLNQLLRILEKVPTERQEAVVSMFGQEFDLIKLRRHNGKETPRPGTQGGLV